MSLTRDMKAAIGAVLDSEMGWDKESLVAAAETVAEDYCDKRYSEGWEDGVRAEPGESESQMEEALVLIRDLLDEAHVVWPQHCHGCSDHTDNPRLCPHQVCDQARQWLKKHG